VVVTDGAHRFRHGRCCFLDTRGRHGNNRLDRLGGALLLLFDPDFLFQRALQLVGRALELGQALPSDRPSSGSFRGPKMISAITKMMISSGMPIEPNIALLLS
jgi:hypothetical protein